MLFTRRSLKGERRPDEWFLPIHASARGSVKLWSAGSHLSTDYEKTGVHSNFVYAIIMAHRTLFSEETYTWNYSCLTVVGQFSKLENEGVSIGERGAYAKRKAVIMWYLILISSLENILRFPFIQSIGRVHGKTNYYLIETERSSAMTTTTMTSKTKINRK